ncbi:MAG TPA: hypothetical protein VLI94_09785 [Solirubrobacterales bacterium]|nr:hypothetical protein [Solirubrobacterales bacterium]
MAEPSSKVVADLEAAVAAVKAAKVPKDLRVAAFNAAFYGGQVLRSEPEGSKTPPSPEPKPPVDLSDEIGKIAAKLELDPDGVGLVYDVDEDGVHLTVKRDSLSDTNKFAQQEVTYLLVAGRQALGLEEWTSTKTVLATAHDRGVHDTNVSKAISALDGDGLRFRGPKAKREMKMNAVGFSKAAEIVKRITDAS